MISQILVHLVVDHIVDALVDKTVCSSRSVLINLLVDERVNIVIHGAILLVVVVIVVVVAAVVVIAAVVVVGGTRLLDESCNETTVR